MVKALRKMAPCVKYISIACLMMVSIGMGNNPMVGMTVAVVVAIEQVSK